MLLPYSCHAEFLSNVLQTTLEIFAGPHEILDVVYAWEPDAEKSKELCFGGRQGCTRDDFDKVTEVVAAA